MADDSGAPKTFIQEVLPKAGLVYSEKGNLSECLCKPKIMPLKSAALRRLEGQEEVAAHVGQQQQEQRDAFGADQVQDDDRTKEHK